MNGECKSLSCSVAVVVAAKQMTWDNFLYFGGALNEFKFVALKSYLKRSSRRIAGCVMRGSEMGILICSAFQNVLQVINRIVGCVAQAR